MGLVREILYMIIACKMFYDPSISVLQMLQMLANAVANLMMCCECLAKAKHVYLIYIIYIAGVSLCLISPRPCPISLFSFKFGIFSTCPLHAAEMSILTQANLYKRLTITYKCLTSITNVLPTIRMAYDCPLCFSYEF